MPKTTVADGILRNSRTGEPLNPRNHKPDYFTAAHNTWFEEKHRLRETELIELYQKYLGAKAKEVLKQFATGKIPRLNLPFQECRKASDDEFDRFLREQGEREESGTRPNNRKKRKLSELHDVGEDNAGKRQLEQPELSKHSLFRIRSGVKLPPGGLFGPNATEADLRSAFPRAQLPTTSPQRVRSGMKLPDDAGLPPYRRLSNPKSPKSKRRQHKFSRSLRAQTDNSVREMNSV